MSHIAATVLYPTSYISLSLHWVCLCVLFCTCWSTVPVCLWVCALCLSGSLCLIWLMEVVVEAALPWLQLQAALVFSLTYDNAPVTSTRKPSSTFVVDDRFRFFLALSFFFLCPTFPAAPSISFCFLSQFLLHSCELTHTKYVLLFGESHYHSWLQQMEVSACVFLFFCWMQQQPQYLIRSVFTNPLGPGLIWNRLFQLSWLHLCMDYKCVWLYRLANGMCYHTT